MTNVIVTYEGADLDGNPDSPNPWGTNLGTATVSIEDYMFDLSIPFVGRTLNMPAYSTTLTSRAQVQNQIRFNKLNREKPGNQ